MYGPGSFDVATLDLSEGGGGALSITIDSLRIGGAGSDLGTPCCGPAGVISLAVDLAQTPQPSGFVPVSAGETWSFQVWYRDSNAGAPTSNFTQGLAIDFL